MKKISLALALIFPSIAAMAIEQPTYELAQSENQALTKLYDAELNDIKLTQDGMCYTFKAVSLFDRDKTKPLNGRICGDDILFTP